MHEFFKASVLPQLLAGATGEVNAQPHTLIYVPSYFDFVRLRNTLLRDDVDFMQCSECVHNGALFLLMMVTLTMMDDDDDG